MNKRFTITFIVMIALSLSVAALMIGCGPNTGGGDPQTEQTTTAETLGVSYPTLMTYEEYMKLSPQLQQAYYETFPDAQTYIEWFNTAALEYRENQKTQDESNLAGDIGQIIMPTEQEDATSETPLMPTQKPNTTTEGKKYPVLLTFEEYMELTPAQQQAYYESFPGNDVFMQWFNDVTQEDDQGQTENEETIASEHLEGTIVGGTGRPVNPYAN